MIKIKKFVYFLIITAIINFFTFQIDENLAYCYTQSQAECVIELNSNRIIYSKNENLKLPMASTTKILTALTVIENYNFFIRIYPVIHKNFSDFYIAFYCRHVKMIVSNYLEVQLWHIELLMFSCGIFWNMWNPFFKKGSTYFT